MSRRLVGVAAMTAVLLGGCASGSNPRVDGLRTDPDGQGLVASYTGGSCDGSARLAVRETATQIDIKVEVKGPPELSEACDSAGHLRTVRARLKQPVGTRNILSGGQQQIPFDGARLLLPLAALPLDLSPVTESGSGATSAAGQGGTVTTSWDSVYVIAPAPVQAGTRRCVPSRGRIDVRVGPVSAASLSPDWIPGTTVDVGGVRAKSYREGTRRAPQGFAYTWTTDHSGVVVSNRSSCAGDRLLNSSELLGIARALRPA